MIREFKIIVRQVKRSFWLHSVRHPHE